MMPRCELPATEGTGIAVASSEVFRSHTPTAGAALLWIQGNSSQEAIQAHRRSLLSTNQAWIGGWGLIMARIVGRLKARQASNAKPRKGKPSGFIADGAN